MKADLLEAAGTESAKKEVESSIYQCAQPTADAKIIQLRTPIQLGNNRHKDREQTVMVHANTANVSPINMKGPRYRTDNALSRRLY